MMETWFKKSWVFISLPLLTCAWSSHLPLSALLEFDQTPS